MQERQTQGGRVVITATTRNGDKIEMLAYPDGGCGLTCNGLPIPHTQSVPCNPEQCGAELLRLCEFE